MNNIVIKIIISLLIILLCTYIARKYPSFAGLIATMPITGLLVLIWIYLDNSKDINIVTNYAKGAVFGIFPTLLFFISVFLSLKNGLSFKISLICSAFLWLLGAFIHQYFLK